MRFKEHFPAIEDGLVYLDSGATSLKPKPVIDALTRYYYGFPANVHRGAYPWADRATREYESAREKVANLIHARPEEVVFTKNATEALNLAASILANRIGKGDRVLVSVMEHHANFLPWMRLARERGAEFVVFNITPEGYVDLKDFERKLTGNTKILALTMTSNVLGTVPPFKEMAKMAKDMGAFVVLDGAQYLPHHRVRVRSTGADFIAFSGHKVFGPMGTGFLWGREEILREGRPLLVGGSMIRDVSVDGYEMEDTPQRYEAGTPNVAGVIGLGAAADFITSIGYEEIERREKELTSKLYHTLRGIEGVEIYGPPPEDRGALISFNLKGVHPHDVAWYLGELGIMLRSGGHCAHPLHKFLKIPYNQSVRASLSFFNDEEDIERLAEGIERVKKAFRLT